MKARPRLIDFRRALVPPAEGKRTARASRWRLAKREARADPPLTNAQRSRLGVLLRG